MQYRTVTQGTHNHDVQIQAGTPVLMSWSRVFRAAKISQVIGRISYHHSLVQAD